VLRHGVTDHGVKLRLAFFKPATTLNPEAQALYHKNILTITRQVHHSVRTAPFGWSERLVD
jgi:type I restriction enzyme R subunit